MTPSRRPRREGGFTIMEVLIAMSIAAIGLVGILALQRGAMQASGYSRRATEASILGEDKLEALRTVPIGGVMSNFDIVDASGTPNSVGPFTRRWTVTPNGSGQTRIDLAVTWNEKDGAHTLTFRTLRKL